jgi:mono/diheme cytochrome c family protein
MEHRLRLAFAVTALMIPGPTKAQDTATTGGQKGLSTLSGVYTEQQAERGEQTYAANCMRCHDKAAYTGASFAFKWASQTAFDLFELIRSTMPNDKPSSLPRDRYLDLVAYLFKLNGLPAGKQALPSDRAALQQIRIAVKDSTPP